MKVTTKSLRTRAREILDCVDRGEPVTITYRGKPRAKLTSIAQEKSSIERRSREMPVFGMWSDREDIPDVDLYVREIRKGRSSVD
ncbi:MAG: type II toxin-antitoxin system prevent-host-death family antitoxin [Gammaproteobacteria bacterium]|nr:MAG: type II toxin-antitoxin system prevent-host-death family antitoxin [Gammaproteobacteria bacterium]